MAKQRVLEKHKLFYQNLDTSEIRPRPLLQLMMHEFCEYMNHQSQAITLDDTFIWFTKVIQDKINSINESTEEKQNV